MSDWYRTHLFIKQASPVYIPVEKARIRTLDWKPPAKIRLTGCMLCAVVPMERVRNRTWLKILSVRLRAIITHSEIVLVLAGFV